MAGPTKRKSPIEHKVKKHKHMGTIVEEFKRGSGKNPNKPTRSRPKVTVKRSRKGSGGSEGGYRVRLWYVDRNTEEFDFRDKSFQSAQKTGFSKSSNVIHPIKVSIRSI